jgi:hypothetical protein
MATSPIYGWAEPDDTSLVKNGALAMRTLGNAIDTTMATMVPKSIVDAKGDLIAATAADTVSRLAVGTNGQVLTVDSTAATGLKWAATSGGTAIAAATDYVSTTENTTSASYTGLTTASSVTVTTGTKALVSISAVFDNAAGVNVQGYMSFAVSGATTVASTDTRAVGMNFLANPGNFKFRAGGAFVITGLTAGSNTFTTQFKKMGGDTPYFGQRSISVIDLGS